MATLFPLSRMVSKVVVLQLPSGVNSLFVAKRGRKARQK